VSSFIPAACSTGNQPADALIERAEVCVLADRVIVGRVLTVTKDSVSIHPWGCAEPVQLELASITRASVVPPHAWSERAAIARRQRAGLSAVDMPDQPPPRPPKPRRLPSEGAPKPPRPPKPPGPPKERPPRPPRLERLPGVPMRDSPSRPRGSSPVVDRVAAELRCRPDLTTIPVVHLARLLSCCRETAATALRRVRQENPPS